MDIKELYAMCYQNCTGIDRDDVHDLMDDFARLVLSPTIGDMNDNQKEVIAQIIQDYGQRIHRVRSGLNWQTGEICK